MSIVKKDKVYFFRGYVPKKLLTLLKQQTFDKSLKTKNKNIAIIKAKPLAIRFKYLMKELEFMIKNNSDIYAYLDKYLNNEFKNRENILYKMSFTKLDELVDEGFFANHIDLIQHIVSENDFSIINEYIKEALSNYTKEINDTEMYMINQYIAEKLLEQAIIIRTNVKNGYYDIPPQPQQDTKQNITNTSIETIEKIVQPEKILQVNNLKYYIRKFLKNEEIESSSSIDAISLRETALKSLSLEFGNINVKEITRAMLTEYRDRLSELPNKSLAKTNVQYSKAKNLIDIITINKEHNYTEKTISEGTVGKYIRIVKNFFKYLNDYDYIDKNIADGLKLKKTTITQSKDRLPFTSKDLEVIFSSSFYTTKLEDNIKKKIEKVFIPIIAIYSGMRLNEISSLYVNDIKIEKGIYYFDINNEKDKTVKNKMSIRKVPIHKKIIEAGFLDYIATLSQNSTSKVWTNLTIKVSNKETEKGTYSSNISNWFRNFKNPLGFNKQKVFHSTRHTAIDNLKQQKVDTIEIAEIVGHSNDSITIDRYSTSYDIEAKQTVINKITYDVKALDKLLPKMKAIIEKT